MHRLRRGHGVLLAAVAALGLSFSLQAATITITSNTNWSAIPGGPPTVNDSVIVMASSVDVALTIDVANAVCSSIVLDSNGTFEARLSFNAASGLTVTNGVLMTPTGKAAINMAAGGTLTCGSITSAAATHTFVPGSGTVQLTATNTLPASAAFAIFNNLTVNGAGTNTTVGRSTTVTNALTVAAGTLRLSNFLVSSGSLSGAGSLELGAENFTVNGSSTSTFSGPITSNGTGTLTKAGTGTLTLSGANSQVGNTLVTNGTLVFNGQHSANIIVSGSGVLAGTGSCSGGVDINGTGKLSPGTPGGATGIFTSDVFFQKSGTLVPTFTVRLNGTTAGTGHDQLVTPSIRPGTLSLGGPSGAFLVASLGAGTKKGDTFTIASSTGTLTGTFAYNDLGSIFELTEGKVFFINDVQFSISYVNNKVVLTQLQNPSSIDLTSAINPAAAGQAVTFSATVTGLGAGGTPTGTVTFLVDGVKQAPAVALVNGVATFTTSALSVGNRNIQAYYDADANFALSDSNVVAQGVLAAMQSPSTYAVGAGAGTVAQVNVYDARTGAMKFALIAFDRNYSGGVNVAVGDVNGDSVPDVIVGTATGATSGHVKVFSGATGAELSSFFAFQGFNGGVTVAAGDVNGDGRDDIIVGAGSGAGATGGHVKVFDGVTGALLRSFLAYDAAFAGGVRVAAGDVNGDGRADIITGAGPGATSGHVKAFSGVDNSELRSFFAFDGFSGGVTVAAGDVNGDGRADIIVGADAGGGPQVKVFDGSDNSLRQSFFAFAPSFTGGVRVASGDVNGDGTADIIVGAGPGGGPHVRVFSGSNLTQLGSFLAFNPQFQGGVNVGGGGFKVPLSFSSSASATPNPAIAGQSVTFTAATTGAPVLTWNFGDGTAGSGASVAHSYRVAGMFTATVTASDLGGRTAATSVVVTVNAATTGGAVLPGTIDSDGDGYSDGVEKAYGSDPLNTDSRPGNGPPIPSRLNPGRFTFKIPKNPSAPQPGGRVMPTKLTLTGTLEIPADFNATGKIVVADIAGFAKKFTLDKKGKSVKVSRTDKDTFSVAIKAKKGKVAAQSAKFTLVLYGVPSTVTENSPYQVLIENLVFTK